jgi:hypothetical protein
MFVGHSWVRVESSHPPGFAGFGAARRASLDGAGYLPTHWLLAQPLIITVIGKAFFDISHAPADHSNRRTDLQGYAAWEIHPVMKLEIQ